jgi:hypothetical protein
LYDLRNKLESRRQSCALFDTRRWVRNLEVGIAQVWRKQEARLPPDHIIVEDANPIYVTADASLIN